MPPSEISAAVSAASPSLPGGSFCDPTWNQTLKVTLGSWAIGISTGSLAGAASGIG